MCVCAQVNGRMFGKAQSNPEAGMCWLFLLFSAFQKLRRVPHVLLTLAELVFFFQHRDPPKWLSFLLDSHLASQPSSWRPFLLAMGRARVSRGFRAWKAAAALPDVAQGQFLL